MLLLQIPFILFSSPMSKNPICESVFLKVLFRLVDKFNKLTYLGIPEAPFMCGSFCFTGGDVPSVFLQCLYKRILLRIKKVSGPAADI